MADPTPSKPPSSGRGLKIALGLSLMLNLAVAGVVAGAALNQRAPGRADVVRDLGFGPFTEALSDEDRTALRRSFLREVPDFRDMRRTMRTDLVDMLAVLRAEPFDPAALESVFARQNARMSERLALGQRLLFDRVAAMTPAARAAFADRLEQSLMRRGGRGDRDGDNR
jgi:uncharacterized membrane protein